MAAARARPSTPVDRRVARAPTQPKQPQPTTVFIQHHPTHTPRQQKNKHTRAREVESESGARRETGGRVAEGRGAGHSSRAVGRGGTRRSSRPAAAVPALRSEPLPGAPACGRKSRRSIVSTSAPATWTSLAQWGVVVVVRSSRGLASYLEEPGDLALSVDGNALRRGAAREPGHRHDITRQCDDELAARAEANVCDVERVTRRGVEKLRVV